MAAHRPGAVRRNCRRDPQQVLVSRSVLATAAGTSSAYTPRRTRTSRPCLTRPRTRSADHPAVRSSPRVTTRTADEPPRPRPVNEKSPTITKKVPPTSDKTAGSPSRPPRDLTSHALGPKLRPLCPVRPPPAHAKCRSIMGKPFAHRWEWPGRAWPTWPALPRVADVSGGTRGADDGRRGQAAARPGRRLAGRRRVLR